MLKTMFKILVVLIVIACVICGYSKITDKPIIFEEAYFAMYDGMPYYEFNHGRVQMDKRLVHFKAYSSLIFNNAVVIFKADKGSPTFSIIYSPGPGETIHGRGWVDDNCDGKFRPLNVEDKAVVPECHRQDELEE